MIGAATAFMVTPHIVFEPTGGSNGSFSWGLWRLRLREDRTTNVALPYAKFVMFCRTMYHETRHSEQFYRIAQGLSAGALTYPEKSNKEVAQAMVVSGGVTGFANKRNLFESIATGASIDVNDRLLSEWLDIPAVVAASAYASRAQFAAFQNSAKPNWCKRDSILHEVEDWMRATYSGSLSQVNSWTQSDEGTYDMYRDQPEEADAHGIGNAIVAAIDAATGIASGVPPY